MIGRYGSTYDCIDLLRAAASEDAEESLRQGLARLHRVRHIFLFDSARSALGLLLRAHGHQGGEILVPGYTCIVVPESVASAGYIPVFADVEERSVNMSAETLSKAISPRTVGVIVTHQFGLPCDVQQILDVCRLRNLFAIEDAAASIGATVNGVPVGSFGDAAIISFYHTKVIAAGRGGALLTDNDDLAKRITALLQQSTIARRNSWSALCNAAAWKLATSQPLYPVIRRARKLIFDESTFGFEPPKAVAAQQPPRCCAPAVTSLFRMQLERLQWNLDRRRRCASIYSREVGHLFPFEAPSVADGVLPAWIQYPVFVPNKSDLCHYALRRSVDLSWTFRYCAAESYGATHCYNSTRAAQTIVGLPTYPTLGDAAVYRICSVLRQYAASAMPSCSSASAR